MCTELMFNTLDEFLEKLRKTSEIYIKYHKNDEDKIGFTIDGYITLENLLVLYLHAKSEIVVSAIDGRMGGKIIK